MKLINYQAKTPEENIAVDEFLLMQAEEGIRGETMRFWEGSECFVVLGRSEKMEENCFFDECRKDGIKILRRISGGGTVLQGKGCFNYSLVLSYGRAEEFKNIKSSYRKILENISNGFRNFNFDIEVLPISDLALEGKKISGNAQARKKKYLLHHGTILLDFDINKVQKYLKHPPKEPEYRNGRSHKRFITNVSISREKLGSIFKDVFVCEKEPSELSLEDEKKIQKLIEDKYSKASWNLVF